MGLASTSPQRAEIIRDHAAAIAANLAYWADGAAAVRRDTEIANSVARSDIWREGRAADQDRLFCRIGEAIRGPESAAPVVSELDFWAAAYLYEAEGKGIGAYDPELAAEDCDHQFGEKEPKDWEPTREDRAAAFSAEGEFLAVCRERTGISLAPEKLDEHRAAANLLVKLTRQIADKMRGGSPLPAPFVGPSRPIECKRDTLFELRRYYVHSGESEILDSWRRIAFLPAVAQALRAPIVAALEFWLSRNLTARFWTFTTGPRCRIWQIRERHDWLCAKLADLNEQKFMKDAGLRIVFAAHELGTPEKDERGERNGGEIERDESGNLTFHPHAHCVVEMTKGYVENFGEVVRKVGEFWPFFWDEGGQVEKARECCKYLTKPMTLLKMTGGELVTLQQQLSRAKLVRPMGSLADEIRERREKKQRLVRKTTKDGRVYVCVKDWNKHGRKTQNEKDLEKINSKESKARGLLRIVSRGIPRFGASGVAEPVVCVMSLPGSWDEAALRKHALVAPMIAATASQWRQGCERQRFGISVHTRTLTPKPDEAAERKRPERGLRLAPAGAERRGF